MLRSEQRHFIQERRTATLATVSGTGQPRLVPVCFVLADPPPDEPGPVLYTPLDEKPKRGGDLRELARVRDIMERPAVTLLFDRWSEDWSHLAWLRAGGTASLLEPDQDPSTHGRAVAALRAKYPQYRSQAIDERPMLRIVIDHVTSWEATRSLPGE